VAAAATEQTAHLTVAHWQRNYLFAAGVAADAVCRRCHRRRRAVSMSQLHPLPAILKTKLSQILITLSKNHVGNYYDCAVTKIYSHNKDYFSDSKRYFII
jgi:hypothetical protein